MNQNNLNRDKYQRVKMLGRGAFGIAYLAICRDDFSYVTIKEISLAGIQNMNEINNITKEWLLLQYLKHPYIIGFREVFIIGDQAIWIVMEYAGGGDLLQTINTTKAMGQRMPESQVLDWFTQVCLALKHIHSQKIIHRDIKPENIFIVEEDNSIRIGDFGVSRVLSHSKQEANTIAGTPFYFAPEIFNNQNYTNKVDIWSLGILLYHMCALEYPIKPNNLLELAIKVTNFGRAPPLPKQYSKDVTKLIDSILIVDPMKRPSIDDILKMKAIKSRAKKLKDGGVRIEKTLAQNLSPKRFFNTSLHISILNPIFYSVYVVITSVLLIFRN